MKEMKSLWEGIGWSLVILSICIGVGSCTRIVKDTGPLIQPTIQIYLK